jgi:RNA polymerase sigma factor (sigma-70 family)
MGGSHRSRSVPSLSRLLSDDRFGLKAAVLGRMVIIMGGREPTPSGSDGRGEDVMSLVPIVRRIVASRVPDQAVAEDLVQETLLKVMSAAHRVDPDMLEPYAIATARNVVASLWKAQDVQRRNQHRVLDLALADAPDDQMVRDEERRAVSAALGRLNERERTTLLAHEVSGQDTRSLARELNTSAGAVAAQLNRTRARLRVEYLLALQDAEPPTDRCRPVLLAISGADRRRQREVGAARHLLECEHCAELSEPLLQRGQRGEDEVRIHIHTDADIVRARQSARQLAAQLEFSRTDLTLIATAVSEIARNIVRFAGQGQMFIELLDQPRAGVRIVAHDAGPGIADVELALSEGYSTYGGLGLGLPGARRLMDEFTLRSAVGEGTTVTMTKWRREG